MQLVGHSAWIRTIEFISNGILLASASEDNTIKIWNIETRKAIKTLKGHTNGIFSIAICEKRKLIASVVEIVP